MQGGHNK